MCRTLWYNKIWLSNYFKIFKFICVSLSIFDIVQNPEIQFSWFFLQMDHIVVLCPVEPLHKIFGPISQVFKFKWGFEYFLSRFNSINNLGIIPFAKLLTLIMKKPPEYFTHFLHLFKSQLHQFILLQALVVCFLAPCKISSPYSYYAPCAIWLLSHSTNGVKYPKSYGPLNSTHDLVKIYSLSLPKCKTINSILPKFF
jgi:hypothetical protein